MNGEGKQEKAIVPGQANEPFRKWSLKNFSTVFDFKTNGVRPELKQAKTECDKNARTETFRIELQIRSRSAF